MEDNQPSSPAENPSGGEATPVVASPAPEAQPAAPAPAPAAPTSEPVVTAEPAPAPSPAPEPVQPAPADPARQPRPAERKIRDLLTENKELRGQLGTDPLPQISPQPPRLSDQFAGRADLDPAELDQAGANTFRQGAQIGQGIATLEVAKLRKEMVEREAINDADVTASRLPNEYPELNPSGGTYNEALDAKITRDYQTRAVRVNPITGRKEIDPSVKLSDIAKENVEFFRSAAEAGKAQSSATLSSQADSAAITPSPGGEVSGTDVPFEQKPLAEQEAILRAKGHDI